MTLLATSTVANAATVHVQAGEVFIDRGRGYAAVLGSTSAEAGDIVMAKFGGSAVIVYDDGCIQRVDVGRVVAVANSSPCGGYAIAPEGPDFRLIAGGAAVAAGVGAAIVLSGGGGGDRPASGE